MSAEFRDRQAGSAVVALLADLPPQRRDALRAIVREGRSRLRARSQTMEGEMDIERETAATRQAAPVMTAAAAAPLAAAATNDWREAESALARLRAAGGAEQPATAPAVAPAQTRAGADASGSLERHIVRLSAIAPERLRWLSPGRLAAGKITVLDGDPGLGKSTLLCELAARVSCGQPLPGGAAGPPRGVILLSAEDDPHDTIRPRLDAAGGDPDQVIALMTVPDGTEHGRPFVIPGDVPVLERLVQLMDAALVIVDPLVAFLDGKLSANNDQDVRRALAALKGVTERTGAAVVAVRHLNKTLGTNALYRGGGSIGIIGAARCGLLLARDPDDPERRILAVTKGNLARTPASLAFRLADVPGADVARVVWDGESRWAANTLLREADKGDEDEDALPSPMAEARAWLREALASGPRPAKAMAAEAAAQGISENTLKRARRAEGIVARKERELNGGWLWLAPMAGGEEDHPAGPEPLRLLHPLRPLLPDQSLAAAPVTRAEDEIAPWERGYSTDSA